MKSKFDSTLRFMRVHWFSLFMGFIGTVVLALYVLARTKYSDLLLRVGVIYMADLMLIILFLLMVALVIYYVERQHRIRTMLAETSGALRQSEARLRGIFEQATDIIFALDSEGSITFVSPNTEEITGFSPEEVIGRHFTQFLTEDSRTVAAFHFGRSQRGETESENFETNLIMKDSRLIPVAVRASAIRSDGEFIGAMGMLADLRTSRQMEAEILRYTRALTVLSEIGASISHSFNIDAALRESLTSTIEMTGMDSGAIYSLDERAEQFGILVHEGISEDLLVKTSIIDVPGLSIHALSQPMREIVVTGMENMPPDLEPDFDREGLTFICGIPLIAHDSWVGLLSLSSHGDATLDSDGEDLVKTVAQKLAVALENSKLLDQLVLSRNRLEATLESMDDPVLVMSVDGEIGYINSRFQDLISRPRDRIIGHNVLKMLERDRVLFPEMVGEMDEVAERFWQTMNNPGAHFEVKIGTDRNVRDYQIKIAEVKVARKTTDYVCVMHDITGYKRLDQMKSDFVAAASHQLRTPLASIVGFTETIIHHYDDLDESSRKEYTEIVARQGRKLASIVNDLLDFSRLEEGELTLDRENIYVPELAEKVVTDFEATSPQHRFHIEFSVGFPAIYADYFKVEHVLNNLVANAVKYSPEGGAVTIAGKEVEGGVEVWVSDEGVGMSPEEIDKLFTRFYRLPHKVMTGAGTGLGLYIVKMLLDAHGGLITVDSKPGVGSTFKFFLPGG